MVKLKKPKDYFTKNKGNPVPSIDSKDIKLIIEALCAYGDDEEITNLCDKLENGVETDNEQPKNDYKCPKCKKSYTAVSGGLCYECFID